jgi:hypothetical protein
MTIWESLDGVNNSNIEKLEMLLLCIWIMDLLWKVTTTWMEWLTCRLPFFYHMVTKGMIMKGVYYKIKKFTCDKGCIKVPKSSRNFEIKFCQVMNFANLWT